MTQQLAASGIAALWEDNVLTLDLRMPPARFSRAEVSAMLEAIVAVDVLRIHGPEINPDGQYGLLGNLAALDYLGGLEGLHLSHHRGLTSLEALNWRRGLSNLQLHDTGVRQWPDQLSTLDDLSVISITQPAPVSNSPDNLNDRILDLPPSFFEHLCWLQSLQLDNHSILLRPLRTFGGLTYLRNLDLNGCDLLCAGEGGLQALTINGTKPLQGLKGLCWLSLRNFAPFCGGWAGMQRGLYDLGVTSLTGLGGLDLSCNSLQSVPEGLSLLAGLRQLDLSNDHLPAPKLVRKALSALTRLSDLIL